MLGNFRFDDMVEKMSRRVAGHSASTRSWHPSAQPERSAMGCWPMRRCGSHYAPSTPQTRGP